MINNDKCHCGCGDDYETAILNETIYVVCKSCKTVKSKIGGL